MSPDAKTTIILAFAGVVFLLVCLLMISVMDDDDDYWDGMA